VYKAPVAAPRQKTAVVRSASPVVIVFNISAMDATTVDAVKKALQQKAEAMIQTVLISYDDLEELDKQSNDELMLLQSDDVTIEIGKPAIYVYFSSIMIKVKYRAL